MPVNAGPQIDPRPCYKGMLCPWTAPHTTCYLFICTERKHYDVSFKLDFSCLLTLLPLTLDAMCSLLLINLRFSRFDSLLCKRETRSVQTATPINCVSRELTWPY